METENKLTMWDFEAELKTMAVSCIGVKESTAKKKASLIFKKYEDLLSYSKSDKEYAENELLEMKLKFEVLKLGRICYSGQGGNVKGFLLIKDIEQIEIRETEVLIIMKTGREIKMDSGFKYLKDLF